MRRHQRRVPAEVIDRGFIFGSHALTPGAVKPGITTKPLTVREHVDVRLIGER